MTTALNTYTAFLDVTEPGCYYVLAVYWGKGKVLRNDIKYSHIIFRSPVLLFLLQMLTASPRLMEPEGSFPCQKVGLVFSILSHIIPPPSYHISWMSLSVLSLCLLARGGTVGWGVAGRSRVRISTGRWLTPSDHIIALGSNQPVTELSTRNVFWEVKTVGE